MLRIHFTGEDLARTTLRAEPDPLWEALLSLHMLQVDDGPVPYGAWRRRQRRQLPKDVVRPLTALAPPVGYSPDFLTPSVDSGSVGEAIDAVLSTPKSRVRSDLARLSPRTGLSWVRQLAEAQSETMERLGHALRVYHRSALAPYWSSIEEAIKTDRRQRQAQFVSGGLGAVLENIHPEARWRNGVLEIASLPDEVLRLEGRGLRLQPSYFCWQQPTKLLDTNLPPVLVFPIEGASGLLRLADQEADSLTRLVAVLGRTRALMLASTVKEMTTSDLATACGIAVGTASYQTGVLREAGLITSRRDGKAVVHSISNLGRALLTARPLEKEC
ncbi:helix-turn-helix domain-containing protein [Kribbella sp. NPDC023855]|uniref:ArsR/SmtB family transcription factor n=1 Tax=Kribbella sp. NPDC023855 TaxID=3154698 RepID=UPI0033F62C6D